MLIEPMTGFKIGRQLAAQQTQLTDLSKKLVDTGFAKMQSARLFPAQMRRKANQAVTMLYPSLL